MKIGLNIHGTEPAEQHAAQVKALEHLILNAQKGDWEAKERLGNQLLPVIVSLAEKRTHEQAIKAKYIEAGQEGLAEAIRKFKPSVGGDSFQIFAVEFMERAMDHVGKGGGFFARLFGR